MLRSADERRAIASIPSPNLLQYAETNMSTISNRCRQAAISVAAMALLTAAVTTAGCASDGAKSSGEATANIGADSSVDASTDRETASSVGARLGNIAPQLDGRSLDGAALPSMDASHAVLISFWSSTCQRAVQVVPRLKQIALTYPSEQLLLIGPSADDETSARAFQRTHDIREYRLLYDATEALERFEVTEYPTAFLLDRDGRITWRGDPTSPSLETAIASVLGPRL